jgi:hypothetical protein
MDRTESLSHISAVNQPLSKKKRTRMTGLRTGLYAHVKPVNIAVEC